MFFITTKIIIYPANPYLVIASQLYRAPFIWSSHIHLRTDRANACISLLVPTAARIKFKILVLAGTEDRMDQRPSSLQAAIQQYMPASVLCSATDLFALLGCSVLHTASTILSPGSLMVQWPSRRIQNIQNSSQSPPPPTPQGTDEKRFSTVSCSTVVLINDELSFPFTHCNDCLRRLFFPQPNTVYATIHK